MWQQFLLEEDGQTLVEYAMLTSLISLVVIVALTVMGKKTSNVFLQAGDGIEAPAKQPGGG
jgi:pilus assembly protein Flp/PilA